ncbi:hypothetical protein HGRIS_005702 [Hohenbuehelia grisea]|uniref:Cytochrome P450 n=1 Tax=Hohenbuehelia grisea TaxID=104357 RepID=A0ABR3JZX0_9AGAR
MFTRTDTAQVFIASSLAIIGLVWIYTRKSSLKRPPGPSVSWFSLLSRRVEMPRSFPWLTYAKWQEVYGDMIFLGVVRNPILVLNSSASAQDLLEKRSAIYSSRPVRTMQAELMGFSFLFSGLPYDSWYKQHRNMFHKYFQSKVVSNYHHIQLKHTHTLLRNLLHDCSQLDHFVRRTTAAIVLEITYGHQVAEQGDHYVTLADRAMAGVTQSGNFGTFMVDYIPILKYVPEWMPGAEFKRKARGWKKLALEMLNYPFTMVKDRLENGSAEPCLTTLELENWFREGMTKDPSRELVIKDVAATAYAAGSDTTLSTIITFFLAMVLHPEYQKIAQAEIDRAGLGDRLPTFADRPNLPFIECIVWESLRWNPAVNISLAHRLTEHDEYKGYSIPKGTTVLGNIWAMLHDPTSYPEPHAFKPTRFVDPERNLKEGINPNPELAFGFGRRICPGRFLALDTIWIVAVSVLSAFELAKSVDEDGNEVEPVVEYNSGLFSRPKPFKFRMVPRSEKAAVLVTQSNIS